MRTCRLISLLMAIIITTLFFSFSAMAIDASIKDDAYHYMHSGVDDHLYNERWYFNAVSNDTNLRITYLVSDPENLTGMSKFQVMAVVVQDGNAPIVGVHQGRGIGGDRNSPNLDIDQSGISSQEEPNIRVWGAVDDIASAVPIRWDLEYQPAVAPWFGIPVQMHVGHSKGDWMKWLVYMPSAKVTGTVTIANRTFDISGVGFHDHNWGRYVFNDPRWNFAQVSKPQDGFSLVVGDAWGEQRNTALGVTSAGKPIKFAKKQIALNYTDFALDPQTSRTYPIAYKVTADNGEYLLDLNITVRKNVPLLVEYPSPKPSYVIFSQISDFQGTLKSKTGAEYGFDEIGFSEYTTHRLHPIFGKINDSEGKDTGISNAGLAIVGTNERTGQTKKSDPSSQGWFSIDASYGDYLANSSAPWVADGDKVKLSARNAVGKENSTEILINLTADRQEADMNL